VIHVLIHFGLCVSTARWRCSWEGNEGCRRMAPEHEQRVIDDKVGGSKGRRRPNRVIGLPLNLLKRLRSQRQHGLVPHAFHHLTLMPTHRNSALLLSTMGIACA